MMNAFQSAAAASLQALQGVAGESITYQVGTSTISDITAVAGTSTLTLDDGQGGTVRVFSRDFIVAAADLTLGLPQSGHRIIRDDVTPAETFEVMEPPYRPSDHSGARLRIHTKQVAS